MSQTRTPLIERTAPWGEIRRALIRVQKSNRNAPAYSRWVNRPLGRVFAATCYRWGLTPNHVTAISAAFTFTGIALIATGEPSWWRGILITVLLVLGYALDSSDGQVARLQGGGRLVGEWLDHVVDSVKTGSIHLAVLVMWFLNLGDWSLASTFVPIVFALQATVWFFAIILTDLLMRNAGAKQQKLAVDEGKPSTLNSLLGIPVDYGFLCLTFVLLGWFDGWRWLYALLAAANVAILLLQSVRWYRRVSAAG
ncbi:CDP-alcohol phosphatidyltransferase family protein [Propioniciclava soli]|uniref:CDP-alcohol phosphatidyltransferase family protein n=1 Tax=Propioniciclava soli TaxID=2775081 RepID=UPI001E345AA2|nr:CDP-alcohol phosphatidyltransferase family protein [Propioniciclava soli]